MNPKDEIKKFWHKNPCSRNLIAQGEGSKGFFEAHDRIIDKLTPYNREIFAYEQYSGKIVLEVGCGMGCHAARFAKNARKFVAIDLSFKGAMLTKQRFEINAIVGLIIQADAENLPFKENSFDHVYSNGVIHHTPDTQKAANEIYRVLKNGSSATIMLYHKHSIFYYYDLMLKNGVRYALLKTTPLFIIYPFRKLSPRLIMLKEKVNMVRWGNFKQFSINISDGFGNPHTKVYTKKEATKIFKKFKEIKFDVRGSFNRLEDRLRFIEKRFGWGLFVFLKK